MPFFFVCLRHSSNGRHTLCSVDEHLSSCWNKVRAHMAFLFLFHADFWVWPGLLKVPKSENRKENTGKICHQRGNYTDGVSTYWSDSLLFLLHFSTFFRCLKNYWLVKCIARTLKKKKKKDRTIVLKSGLVRFFSVNWHSNKMTKWDVVIFKKKFKAWEV